MYKQTINNISLQLVMQQPQVVINPSMSHTGVLSKDGDGFRFEEAVKIKRPRRNPKLYHGQYVSLVHRSDGKYSCTLKCISPQGADYDHHDVAFKIYLELIDALQIIVSFLLSSRGALATKDLVCIHVPVSEILHYTSFRSG